MYMQTTRRHPFGWFLGELLVGLAVAVAELALAPSRCLRNAGGEGAFDLELAAGFDDAVID